MAPVVDGDPELTEDGYSSTCEYKQKTCTQRDQSSNRTKEPIQQSHTKALQNHCVDCLFDISSTSLRLAIMCTIHYSSSSTMKDMLAM